MRLDSHQHFWNYDEQQYPWIQHGWPIRRSYGPEDLAPELAQCGLAGSVAVQARQSLTESRWLLELAERSPLIKGVVGWVDLRSPELPGQLAEFSPHPKFVGVRHVVQDEPDDEFMLTVPFQRGIDRLREFDLTYDLLVYPRQLMAAGELAHAFPHQPFVLDHIAKPLIRKGEISDWAATIRELAALPNVSCKVSGMVTEADWRNWQPADFKPYLDVVFAAFGPERVMYGSDWPVCLLAGEYARVFERAQQYVRPLGAEAEARFFGGNAAAFYGLT